MEQLSRHIRLDFRSQEPIYLQIVRQVEKLVRDGILRPGDQLPTVRQLAIDLRINFSTVARAYHVLDEQKLISTQRGRGTYIWDDIDLDDRSSGEPPQSSAKIDRDQTLEQIASRFIEEVLKKGISLDEIERAIQREIDSRK